MSKVTQVVVALQGLLGDLVHRRNACGDFSERSTMDFLRYNSDVRW